MVSPDIVATPDTSDTASVDSVSDTLKAILADGHWQPSRVAIDWKAVRAFYSQRDNQPAWSDATDVERARDALAHADHEGLDPKDYAADLIVAPADDDPARLARYDLLLTNAVLAYAHDVRLGRLAPNDVYGDVDLKPQVFDASDALFSAFRDDTLEMFFASLPPRQPGYVALRSMLARYRAIAAEGGWQMLPDNRTIAPRTGDPLFAALRARLDTESVIYNDVQGPAPTSVRDALLQFQRSHHLAITGVADDDTLDKLNVSVEQRIAEIEANMERWRWLPGGFEDRYVIVNVPSGTLEAIKGGTVALKSLVVVGRQSDPTPLLAVSAVSLTVNPVWHIPTDIARSEILPKAASDPSYLRAHGITMVDRATLRMTQAPGPTNELGTVRFDMPNKFLIYLHDTPGHEAFALDQRDQSHGCLHVEQIVPLSSVALTGDPGKATGMIESAIRTGQQKKFAFSAPLPVYVVYWTVTESADGMPEFWPDIYGRDQRLTSALHDRNAEMRLAAL